MVERAAAFQHIAQDGRGIYAFQRFKTPGFVERKLAKYRHTAELQVFLELFVRRHAGREIMKGQKLLKKPLWIKVPQQNEMRHHPTVVTAQAGGRHYRETLINSLCGRIAAAKCRAVLIRI